MLEACADAFEGLTKKGAMKYLPTQMELPEREAVGISAEGTVLTGTKVRTLAEEYERLLIQFVTTFKLAMTLAQKKTGVR